MRPILPLPSWQADADARLSEAESRVLLAQINADARCGSPLWEALDQAALQSLIAHHRKLKQAIRSGIYVRDRLLDQREKLEAERTDLDARIPIALDEEATEAVPILREKRDEVEEQLGLVTLEFGVNQKQISRAKVALVRFQAVIERLRRARQDARLRRLSTQHRAAVARLLGSTDPTGWWGLKSQLRQLSIRPGLRAIYFEHHAVIFLMALLDDDAFSALDLPTIQATELRLDAACEAWHAR